MKYLGQTFSYLKKNFWLPVVVMIIPAVVACFLSTPFWEVSFVSGFDYDPYVSVSHTFRIIFGDSWQYFWPVIVISVFQIIGASLIMSAVDRHFRTGKLSLRSPWRLVNYSIFPMFVGIMIMCAVSVLWRFVLFGLVTLVQWSFSVMHFPTGAALALISAIALALFVVHMLIITPMLYWAPIMVIYGYKFRDAAAMSYKLISGTRSFIGLIVPMLLCAGVQLLIGFLGVHIAIERVCSFFIFLFTNVYIVVYSVVSFYDISGLGRRDVKPHEMPMPQIQKPKTEQKPQVKKPENVTRDDSKRTETPESHKKSNKSQKAAETKKTQETAAAKKTVKQSKGTGASTAKAQKTRNAAKSGNAARKQNNRTPDDEPKGGDDGI